MEVDVDKEKPGEDALDLELGSQALLYQLVEHCRIKHPDSDPLADELVLVKLKYYRKMNSDDAGPHRSLLGSQTKADAGDSSDRHTAKFDRRPNLETVEVALKEANEIVVRSEEPPGPEDQDGGNNHNQACDDE